MKRMTQSAWVGRRALVVVLAVGLSTGTWGCAMRAGTLSPSATFVYPNSNIEPLGAVSISKAKTKIMTAPSLSIQELELMYAEVLEQKGGNALVNTRMDTETKFVVVPLLIIPIPITIVKTKWTLSGIAARMTVGKQELTGLIESDVERLFEKQAELQRAPLEQNKNH